MRHPGKEISAGRVTYLYDKQHLWYALPSGRVLCYPFARFDEEGNITYAKAAWKPAADAKEWPRARLWRGLACENITQAIANDLLRHALRRLADEGFEVVLHVHDEIVLETDASTAEDAAAAFEREAFAELEAQRATLRHSVLDGARPAILAVMVERHAAVVVDTRGAVAFDPAADITDAVLVRLRDA